MIPHAEFERAITQWKIRKQGGQVATQARRSPREPWWERWRLPSAKPGLLSGEISGGEINERYPTRGHGREPAGFAPFGDFGTTRHPAHPRASRAPSPAAPREGLARPSARARAQRAGVVGKVQVPKSPKGEASGEVVAGGGPKGEANPPRVPISLEIRAHAQGDVDAEPQGREDPEGGRDLEVGFEKAGAFECDGNSDGHACEQSHAVGRAAWRRSSRALPGHRTRRTSRGGWSC